MSDDDYGSDEHKKRASLWFETFRDGLCSALEAVEDDVLGPNATSMGDPGRFERSAWQRGDGEGGNDNIDGGGGVMSVMRGRVFEKAGRTELTLGAAGVVNDPFYYQLPLSLGLGYHLNEAWSLSAQGEYVLSFERGPRVSPGHVPTPTIHHPNFAGWAELSWAPFYGKIAVFSSGQMHLDMYLSLGGGVVGDEAGTISPMGTVAVGQRYVLASWCALKFELRHRVLELRNALFDHVDALNGPHVEHLHLAAERLEPDSASVIHITG